jgi:glycosyltransferase involved in cell wall biosynthesis
MAGQPLRTGRGPARDPVVVPAAKVTIGAVVLTLNEETEIERCLASLAWCDDLVVVDSGSTDATCELARGMGARLFENRPDKYVDADQHNWSLDHCQLTTEWTLFVDADEVVTQALAKEIRRYCSGVFDCDAFQLAPKYLFWGRWMKHCMAYPSWHDRLVRRGSVRYEGGVWYHFADGARVGRISEPYLHYGNSKGFGNWLERHNRYSSWEAKTVIDFLDSGGSQAFVTKRKLGLRRLAARLWPARPLLRFILMYIIRGGFLDGPAGLVFCLRYVIYEYMVVEKIIEERRRRDRQPL